MIRVIIVDDQPVVRAGAARILGPDDGFEVVAECDDGDQVVSAVAAHRPDLVLMDVRMRRQGRRHSNTIAKRHGRTSTGSDVHDLR